MKGNRNRSVYAYRTIWRSLTTWEFIAGIWLSIMLTVITWIAEGFQGFLLQQWIFTVLYFAWPIAILTEELVRRARTGQLSSDSPLTGSLPHKTEPWFYYGLTGIVTCGALALVAERCGWTSVKLEIGALLLLSLALPFFAYFSYRRPILGIALVTAIAVMLFASILASPWARGELRTVSVVLLPMLVLLAAPWSGLGLLLLLWAEKSHVHHRLGPLTEFLSMAFLFLPLMYAMWVLGESLPDSETWQPVCVTISGVPHEHSRIRSSEEVPEGLLESLSYA